MAVVHISEAEAARDFHAVMDRVRSGEEVHIESGRDKFAVALVSPSSGSSEPVFERRSILEVLRRAKERGSSLTLDSEFGNDVEAGIRERAHEKTFDPWA